MRIKPVLTTMAVLVAMSVAVACSTGADDTTSPAEDSASTVDGSTSSEDGSSDGGTADLSWLETELTDAETGETFRISDFAGEPVIVQGFAVW